MGEPTQPDSNSDGGPSDNRGYEGDEGSDVRLPTVSEGMPDLPQASQQVATPTASAFPSTSASSSSSAASNVEENADDGDDYETAITATGYGWFQYWVILVFGLANASDAIEILCVSILLPAAECDLDMTSADKGWLSAVPFIGMMIGGYVWGCLGDIFGRRRTIIVSLFVNAFSGLGSAFVQTFPVFLFFRFVSGLGVGGSIPLVWAYVSELQPPSRRGMALSIIASFWMVGNVLVALMAMATVPFDIGFETENFSFHSWRVFLTICALPALITSILMFWMPESPMFLLMKDRKDEALEILRKMYTHNTRRSPYTFPIKVLSSSGLKVQTDASQSCWDTFMSTFLQTWRQTKALFSRSLIFTSIIMVIINFAIQFGYYGLWLWFPELFNRLQQYYNDHPDDKVSVCDLTSFHANNTVEDPCNTNEGSLVEMEVLVNTLIISIAPLPANLWTIGCMDRLGRKFFLVFSMVLSGAAAFGVYFVKSSLDNLILACIFGAVSTMGFNALDCLGAELFPTHLRSTALAVTLLSARIGAILGTVTFGYLVDVYCAIPMFLVAIFLIGGGLLGIVLPNTTRTALM